MLRLAFDSTVPLLLCLAAACGPPTGDGASLAAGALSAPPALHLPFSEPSGRTALDRSGNGNHATLAGPQRVRDELGRALRFDGRDDHVRVPETESLRITGPITLSAWVKTSDPIAGPAPQQREILYRGEANIVFGFEKDRVEGRIYLRCYLRQSMEPLIYREVSILDEDGDVRDGRWHHLAVVFRPGRSMHLYVDGDEAARRDTTMTSLLLSNVSNHHSIGARLRLDGSVDRVLDGLIDDVRIYPAALGADVVEELHRSRLR
jgi:large repetitive protein